MNALGLVDGEAAEAIVVVSLAFDVVLWEVYQYLHVCLVEGVRLTPMGLAAVRMTRERSLNVSDIAGVVEGCVVA